MREGCLARHKTLPGEALRSRTATTPLRRLRPHVPSLMHMLIGVSVPHATLGQCHTVLGLAQSHTSLGLC
eukprot:2974857-Prymnesium_polylepis.1